MKHRYLPLLLTAVLLTACGASKNYEHVTDETAAATSFGTDTASTAGTTATSVTSGTGTTAAVTTETVVSTDASGSGTGVTDTTKAAASSAASSAAVSSAAKSTAAHTTARTAARTSAAAAPASTTVTTAAAKKDTTPPLLLSGGYHSVIKRGETFDLDALVSYADDTDPAPVLTYTGKVDTGTLGDYPVTATVTDRSGNKTTWELNVSVVDSLPVSSANNRTQVNFSDFQKTYAGKNREFGIDISKWQGKVDFSAVKAAGCSFVIMRIGFGGSDISMDEWFRTNFSGATAAGLKVGVYFNSTASTEAQVRAQAKWIASQLDGAALQFPVAFDWEDFGHFQKHGISLSELNHLYDVFDAELTAAGYPTMLYGSRNMLVDVWTNQKQRPVWLAHYTEQTDYTGKYVLWQESCSGRIPGIGVDVDMDVFYTDRKSW